MTFSVYVPPHRDGVRLPVVWYLSGLTCTHANVTEKGEFRSACAELGLIFVAPDTSPRGEKVPGDPASAYDFGLGAGFYVDAKQESATAARKRRSSCRNWSPGISRQMQRGNPSSVIPWAATVR